MLVGPGPGATNDILRAAELNEKIGGRLVTIFAHSQFKGDSMELKPAHYTQDFNTFGAIGDDNISSIRIPEGYAVTVFVDANFKGASKKFTADVADLGDFDNNISSLIVSYAT